MEFSVHNIKDLFYRKPGIIREAEKGRYHPIWILQVLIFIAVFIVTQIVSALPLVAYVAYKAIVASANGNFDPNTYGAGMDAQLALPMLFSTIIVTAIVVVHCRFIEGRSLKSMGFVKEKRRNDYFIGLGIGFLMFVSCVGIAYGAGTLKFNGYVLGNGIGMLVLFFIGFVLQGAEEEILMRGYVMVSVGARYSVLLAILTNSVGFAALHLGNNGITTLAFLNLVLFGVFASVYTLKMDSIWGICAIHSMWNFAQGNLFGISVSGLGLTTSVFSFGLTDGGTLINGGSFGLEGGLAVTLVLSISIILMGMKKGRSILIADEEKNEIKEQEEATSKFIVE